MRGLAARKPRNRRRLVVRSGIDGMVVSLAIDGS
jgi:hypothetical protein